jgi:hypothetical protein
LDITLPLKLEGKSRAYQASAFHTQTAMRYQTFRKKVQDFAAPAHAEYIGAHMKSTGRQEIQFAGTTGSKNY